MRKILEVLMDENGAFHFSTDVKKEEMMDPIAFKQTLKRMIESLVQENWKKRNFNLSPVIRLISMAEPLATDQPYMQVEEFWTTMMFELVPQVEDYAAKLKRPYGFNNEKVERPLTFFPGKGNKMSN